MLLFALHNKLPQIYSKTENYLRNISCQGNFVFVNKRRNCNATKETKFFLAVEHIFISLFVFIRIMPDLIFIILDANAQNEFKRLVTGQLVER